MTHTDEYCIGAYNLWISVGCMFKVAQAFEVTKTTAATMVAKGRELNRDDIG